MLAKPTGLKAKITPRNILAHELIGLEVEVADACDPRLIGKRGIIADETKNTFKIKTHSGLKIIPKQGVTFIFKTPHCDKIKVLGDKLLYAPEKRLAKYGRWL